MGVPARAGNANPSPAGAHARLWCINFPVPALLVEISRPQLHHAGDVEAFALEPVPRL